MSVPSRYISSVSVLFLSIWRHRVNEKEWRVNMEALHYGNLFSKLGLQQHKHVILQAGTTSFDFLQTQHFQDLEIAA